MKLLDSYALGALALPNRMVMAPLTRNRARGTVPGRMNAIYYGQRASAGLIIGEATQVSPLGQGYPHTPGIFSDEQVSGWHEVTEVVHATGGRIFCQLWHVGRVSHSSYHGERPLAPSPVAPPGQAFTPDGPRPYETPHELSPDEIAEVVDQFRRGAENAREAGFDGVEIHGANGYLIDQFLQSGSNRRTDGYGGSVENRVRFLREVIDAVVGVWSGERVGVRLSPGGTSNGVHDDDPVETFSHAARALDPFGPAYIHVVERPVGTSGPNDHEVSATELVRSSSEQPIVSTGRYTRESAEEAIRRGVADLVGFGRLWIANPDLVLRFAVGAGLNEPERSTFYGGGEEGYIDHPTLPTASGG